MEASAANQNLIQLQRRIRNMQMEEDRIRGVAQIERQKAYDLMEIKIAKDQDYSQYKKVSQNQGNRKEEIAKQRQEERIQLQQRLQEEIQDMTRKKHEEYVITKEESDMMMKSKEKANKTLLKRNQRKIEQVQAVRQSARDEKFMFTMNVIDSQIAE
ncbi:MAG: hypothetical protein EZS28_034131 [Streblomastix strix]|uniref:Uncharacterized protein n=1 Tax=Streblomastix strix TaxID=222440 RepID=A0A5J4UK61_9EUKA|nr:MAG: hypothetical protein EZS28_034131 [Streblomastix strix]